jgi:hypothetical protein
VTGRGNPVPSRRTPPVCLCVFLCGDHRLLPTTLASIIDLLLSPGHTGKKEAENKTPYLPDPTSRKLSSSGPCDIGLIHSPLLSARNMQPRPRRTNPSTIKVSISIIRSPSHPDFISLRRQRRAEKFFSSLSGEASEVSARGIDASDPPADPGSRGVSTL